MREDREPLSLEGYEAAGGYQALRKAVQEMPPEAVRSEVKEANLKGRGGAGFPTGAKWSFVPSVEDSPQPRYVVVNGDEMEPGTFKDRLLLESNPHLVLEGAMLSAFANCAENGYIFIRWAYAQAQSAMKRAVEECHEAGLLGRSILGTGFSLEMMVHGSVGRYMCGEEDALLNVLEGKRGTPRPRPPHATVSGLWGRPTVMNNVETVANLPGIVRNGAEWFKALSLTDEGGTKLYGVSGRVRTPGLWELPMGTPLRRILDEQAGGMREGYALRAVLPGGASTEFVVEDQLDVAMDFGSVPKVGSRLGTGGIVVLDDKTCPVGAVANLMEFYARESCGWCTPCRDGLPWVEQTLKAIERGEGTKEDIEVLDWHTRQIRLGHTFCQLAPGAMEPLQSALKYFREDFERHVEEKSCPWRSNHG
jgi:NADH-quinone oxidoreductase subunit F